MIDSTANLPLDRSQERPWKWESQVASLVRHAPSRPAPIICIGSSSFTMWPSLDADVGSLGVLNHGFGGAEISDCNFYWARLVTPFRPKLVVLCAGDNDLANGKSATAVLADFAESVRLARVTAPPAKTLFISIKPSHARWSFFDVQTAVNDAIRHRAASDPRVGFIDIRPAMLGADGRPRTELFAEDGLHLSAAGYAAWAAVLGPHLRAELAALRT
jgi:lysophospholipase L1-like esterase